MVGNAQIQETQEAQTQSRSMAGGSCQERPETICTLGVNEKKWSDGGSRMSREVHVRFCESLWGRFPWATLLVVTFQYYRDAKQFMQEMKTRLQKFNLELAPDKTRLLGDRNNRGQK